MAKVDRLCASCGFPVRRGRTPIIWPDEGVQGDGRATYCCRRCAERGGVNPAALEAMGYREDA